MAQYGLWVFPGGYVDRGEDVRLAAVREAREELASTCASTTSSASASYAGSTPVVIGYSATWTSGELALDEENSEVAVFPPPTLPWDALAFRSTAEALRDYLAVTDAAPVVQGDAQVAPSAEPPEGGR